MLCDIPFVYVRIFWERRTDHDRRSFVMVDDARSPFGTLPVKRYHETPFFGKQVFDCSKGSPQVIGWGCMAVRGQVCLLGTLELRQTK